MTKLLWNEIVIRSCLALLLFFPLIAGCGSNEVSLHKEDKPVVITPPRLEDLPKDQRGGKGSSAGMNYDPSGVNGPPPPR